jgi:hypothetical protein
LSDKYLNGIPEGSRASRDGSLSPRLINDEAVAKIHALNEIAEGRGQSLAQMALAWTLRDARVTSTLVGVQQHRAAGGERRGAGPARLLRRRARGHRPPRDGERHQPLGVMHV